MLRYPSKIDTQQIVLSPLDAIVNQYPACEMWILVSDQVDAVFDNLSVSGLKNWSQVAYAMKKVLDYLFATYVQSVSSQQYLLALATSAHAMAYSASFAATTNPTGTSQVTLDQAAQNALNLLSAWDAVQGYPPPKNPGQLAYVMMNGVSVT